MRWWSWATLVPNPQYEEMVNTITINDAGGKLLIDYMHIATECVPEPATLGLLLLGGMATLRRRK